MKKLLALILAAALALSLVACGGGKTSLSDVAVGTWSGEFTWKAENSSIPSGTRMIVVVDIYTGGTGSLISLPYDEYNAGQSHATNPGTWEVTDDALNFHSSSDDITYGFVFDEEQVTLTSTSNNDIVLTKE